MFFYSIHYLLTFVVVYLFSMCIIYVCLSYNKLHEGKGFILFLPKMHLFSLNFQIGDKVLIIKLDPKLFRTFAKIKGQTSATKYIQRNVPQAIAA